ncbi:CYTH domain-containing protein [Mesorhizobium sp. NBSH29]|uniref:CYTH domain-containing protein n=1 Tax=Mesorhizobium sp. NBSH29 TaxID=2654249 RepID=UPI00189685B4|nr:CYTH domain-containing protein [Mesorhizobium sp. NBSH29]QPC86498.1 CYTH domain-containing protein [Mesorhizobium sp. NBSH29]
MAKEVERKFLVKSQGWRGSAEATLPMRQFYLAATPGRSLRVRIIDGREAWLTMKFGTHARTRDEFEYSIPLEDAEELCGFAIGHVIDKTRHHVSHHGYVYEVDVFEGHLAGLVIAELETPDHVGDAALPHWLGREVTGESEFYNASLATGLPLGAA